MSEIPRELQLTLQAAWREALARIHADPSDAMARERLAGGEKERLAEWFRDDELGDCGRPLLQRAASVETRLCLFVGAELDRVCFEGV